MRPTLAGCLMPHPILDACVSIANEGRGLTPRLALRFEGSMVDDTGNVPTEYWDTAPFGTGVLETEIARCGTGVLTMSGLIGTPGGGYIKNGANGPALPSYSGAFRVSCFVYPTTINHDYYEVLFYQYGWPLDSTYMMVGYGSRGPFLLLNGVAIHADGGAGFITVNNWYKLSIARDASNMVRFYINDSQVGSPQALAGTIPAGPITFGDSFLDGTLTQGGTTCLVDNFYLWGD